MQHPFQTDKRADQMEPYPTAEDLNPGPSMEVSHGTGATFHSTRRGILVSVKQLRVRGVSLTKRERAAAKTIVGELLIERTHDRKLDFKSFAEIVVFDSYHFPSRKAILLNPEVFAADERGMILYGIEKLLLDGGGHAAYWQTWQVLFGTPPPEPPP